MGMLNDREKVNRRRVWGEDVERTWRGPGFAPTRCARFALIIAKWAFYWLIKDHWERKFRKRMRNWKCSAARVKSKADASGTMNHHVSPSPADHMSDSMSSGKCERLR